MDAGIPSGRGIGAGAAVVFLAVLPLAIAPADQDKVAAEESVLAVDLSGDEGAKDAPYLISIEGPEPAPSEAALLRDASGRYFAEAEPYATECEPASERTVFQTKRVEWCLNLEGIPAGHELTGEVSNGSTANLKLTVKRRDAFLYTPLATLVLGLLVGLLATLVPRWLRRIVRRIILNKLLGTKGTRIEDLNDWVSTRRAAGDSDDDLILAIDTVASAGLERAQAARTRLQGAIEELPDAMREYKLVRTAKALALAKSIKMNDFYGADMKPRAHPADEFADAIQRLIQFWREVETQRLAIGELQPGDAQAAIQALDLAEARLKNIEAPSALDTMVPRLEALRFEVEKAQVEAHRRELANLRGGAEDLTLPWHKSALSTLSFERILPVGLATGQLRDWDMAAKFATALLATVALGYAFISIKYAGYDSKPLFHSFGDYLTLFSAAVASGASATVLSLLANWKPVAEEVT